MTPQTEEAIKILSVMHLGYSDRVKNACETAIRVLTRLDSLESEYKEMQEDSEYWRGIKHALDYIKRGNLE